MDNVEMCRLAAEEAKRYSPPPSLLPHKAGFRAACFALAGIVTDRILQEGFGISVTASTLGAVFLWGALTWLGYWLSWRDHNAAYWKALKSIQEQNKSA